ncbi:MAG: hypothetical protein P9E88_02470 [Candidatus Competibacter sp.]|jgi:hypothetical protein|nr:hypothetical protein [Candidatus Competibacter sp.]
MLLENTGYIKWLLSTIINPGRYTETVQLLIMLNKEETVEEKINQLLLEGESHTFQNNCEVKEHGTYGYPNAEFQSWVAEVEDFILSNYGTESSPWRVFSRFNIEDISGHYQDAFEEGKKTIISSLKACLRIKPKIKSSKNIDKDLALKNLFERFHDVAKQLRNRYNSRNTLDIDDEYDVQDLLHALLRLYFDDVRNEEWTPSYAGGSSRMDFLLKKEKIVIEVKKTRKGINDKELGNQLIEDKEKYRSHPDCTKLICFAYDPEGRIVNPKGIENDLNIQGDEFEVMVVIKP